MATPRRPSMAARTLSTPPATPTSMGTSHRKEQMSGSSALPLTPPISPRHSRSFSDLSNNLDLTDQPGSPLIVSTSLAEPSATLNAPGRSETIVTTDESLLQCPFEIEMLMDQRGRQQVFGYGAWSNVYKATTHPRSANNQGIVTPPSSPILFPPILVAVKKPAGKDAGPILENEAHILTYLSTVNKSEQFIISFYGILGSEGSLVLGAVPLSLDDHVRKCAAKAKENLTTWNMTQPVIGTVSTWLDLAHHLITALTWLHNFADVVHGDIKPGNILLVPRDGSTSPFAFQPLLADFTSSQRLSCEKITPNTLSAITQEYTAPELLSSAVLKDPNSTATSASDVFSMAVTLLVAATGNTMVYPGSVYQRQAMARQGWQVLSLVRSGDQGSRIPRHGVVEKALEKAVLKADMGRIRSEAWLSLVEETIRGEPYKL